MNKYFSAFQKIILGLTLIKILYSDQKLKCWGMLICHEAVSTHLILDWFPYPSLNEYHHLKQLDSYIKYAHIFPIRFSLIEWISYFHVKDWCGDYVRMLVAEHMRLCARLFLCASFVCAWFFRGNLLSPVNVIAFLHQTVRVGCTCVSTQMCVAFPVSCSCTCWGIAYQPA